MPPASLLPAPVAGGAVLSPCGAYRYALTRSWANGPAVNFLMLNPSTADATRDDATLRRCVGFARAWGFGRLAVTNLFALRSTDPRALYRHPDPVGPDADRHLLAAAAAAALVVAAWGCHGTHRGRDRRVVELLARAAVAVTCLGRTAGGHPRHPLRLPAALRPTHLATGQEVGHG